MTRQERGDFDWLCFYTAFLQNPMLASFFVCMKKQKPAW